MDLVKSMETSKMSLDSLPTELFLEILSYLPLEQMIRYRRQCQSDRPVCQRT